MTKNSKLPTDLAPLADALEGARTSLGFDAFVLSEIESVLLTVFRFRQGLADSERRSVLSKGIGRAAALGAITPKSLEAAVRREEQTLLAMPARNFTLASHLSFTLSSPLKPTHFMGGVTLSPHLPDRYLKARKKIQGLLPEDVSVIRGYTGVRTRVKARSVGHAFDLAINKIDLLRGVWNFAYLRPTVWASTSDPTAPIARLRPSRIYTLHNPTGKLATTLYWFNPDFREDRFTSLKDGDWRTMQRFLRSVQQRLPKISYRGELERAFVHYARALDSTDMEAAFLKLWSVLELLGGLGGERYETLMERAAFLFAPDAVTRYVLAHLRHQRNAIAHLGNPQSEMRPLVYQLKRFVEQMLAFHIGMGRNFDSLEEGGRFMDLSNPPTELHRSIALMERALRFRHVRKISSRRQTQRRSG